MHVHTFTYNRLPEDEISGSKHVEDSKLKIKILIEKRYFFILYCIIILKCTVQKTKKACSIFILHKYLLSLSHELY